MQTIILCGGTGTRMKEETEFRPKPMVEVGGVPILWHIMQIYMHYGYNDFIIALGYKGDMIREFFLNWRLYSNDFSINMTNGKRKVLTDKHKKFKVTLVDTGLESLTGERIKRCEPYIKGKEFMLTYGDGVSDIDIQKVVDFHRRQGTIATVSGVHPKSRYGLVELDKNTGIVTKFSQQPILNEYISGGFMIFNKEAFDFFTNDEMEVGLTRMAGDGQVSMYTHEGFWKAVDTYKELEQLNKLWNDGRPWAVWENEKYK